MHASQIRKLVALVLLLANANVSLGFSTPGSRVSITSSPNSELNSSFRRRRQHHQPTINQPMTSTNHILTKPATSLQMGYNLPPGGGGGGGGEGDNKIAEFLTPIAAIGGLVLFFMSPLGGIFFAVTNSLFILALLAPILIGVGFNVWNYFNTIEGTCPSCGAPARVLKNIEAGPNICLNCGQLIRATQDLDGIELCNNPNDIFDEKSRVSSIFDIFTSDPSVYEEETITTTTSIFDDGSKKTDRKRRESTIIDIDVEKD